MDRDIDNILNALRRMPKPTGMCSLEDMMKVQPITDPELIKFAEHIQKEAIELINKEFLNDRT